MRTTSKAIGTISSARLERTRSAIGKIQYAVGPVTLIRADGTKLEATVAACVYRGDVIETGVDGRVGITFEDGTALSLSPDTRMVLDEFDCCSDGTLNSAQFCVTRGRFAFITSRTGDNLTIDTPFARIRGTAHGGAIGALTLVALTFVLIQDLHAASPDREFLLDDLITYKDMEHGTFQLVIKGPVPRTIIVDDPEVTVVVNSAATEVQQITNTAADMAALLAASQDAHATYMLGQADPFTTGSVPGQRAQGSGGAFDVAQLTPKSSNVGESGSNTDEPSPNPPPFVDVSPADSFLPTTASIGIAALTVKESDLDGNGSTPGGSNEIITSSGLSFVSGLDAISLSFATNQAPSVNGLDETASLTWQLDLVGDPTGRTLLGTIGGVTFITLTLTGDVTAAAGGDVVTPTVTVVLADNFPHQNAPDADSVTITGLVVNATDADGEITTGTINVTVLDDLPTANADSNSVVEGGIPTGNVLTDADDVFGADGAATTVPVGGLVGVAAGSNTAVPVSGGLGGAGIPGTYGTLILNANGSYTYDGFPNVVPPEGATDTFVYTIEDGDGDLSTTTLTITLTDSGLAASNDDHTVNEAALLIGSNPSSTAETVTGTVVDNVTPGVAPYSYALLSPAVGAHGTLTFNPDGTYSYTLTTPVDGATANNGITTENNVETFTYQLTDANGNTTTSTITIDVTDDVPTARPDTDTVAPGTTTTTGNLFTGGGGGDGTEALQADTIGADGGAVTGVAAGPPSGNVSGGVGSTITTSKGSLVLNADGSYTYTANGTAIGDDVFTYTITDADGDKSTTTLTITIQNTTPTTVDGVSALIVNEAALDLTQGGSDLAAGVKTGTQSNLTTETAVDTNGLKFHATGEAIVSIKFADPNALLDAYADPTFTNLASGTPQWSLSADGQTLTLSFGGQTALILQLSGATGAAAGTDADVTVTATLVNQFAHLVPPSVLDVILGGVKVVATDVSGDQTSATVTVNIVDDGPVFNSVMDAILASQPIVSFTGRYDANFGADGADYLSLVLQTSGMYAGNAVDFIQTPDTFGVTKVEVQDAGTHDVLFTFYYTETQQSDGGVLLAAYSDPSDPSGSAFFALDLNANGTYDFTLYSTSAITSTTVNGSDFGASGSGQPSLTSPDGQLIITGDSNGITADVKASANGIAVGDAALRMDAGETLHLTFAQEQSTVSFILTQWQGTGTGTANVVFHILDGTTSVNDVPINIPKPSGDATIQVEVNPALAGTYIFDSTTATYTIYVASQFNQLQVSYVQGDATFTVNDITYNQSVTINDVTMNFGLSVTDGDGDTSTLADPLTITTVGGAVTTGLTLAATDPAFTPVDGNDGLVLVGGSGNDTLTGGTGDDALAGGAGADQFRLKSNGGTDTVIGYTDNVDKIGFLDNNATGAGSVNFVNTTGSAAGTTLAAGDFQIRTGISNINAVDDTKVLLINATQTTTQITSDTGEAVNSYVLIFNSTTGHGEIWFDTDWSNTGSRVQVATLDNITTLAALTAITNTDIVAYTGAIDPLILDLGTAGVNLTDAANGVAFDLNGDGLPDQTAWTAGDDGILALDVNGNGTIDSGTEIFSPSFAGGQYSGSLAALATLDENLDGVIDASDSSYDDLKVWQDLNHNGVSDDGELSDLATLGITGINLGATATETTVKGQQILSQGTFTYADGSTGGFFEVAFDAELGAAVSGDSGPCPTQPARGETYVIGADQQITIDDFVSTDQPDIPALLDANFADGNDVDDLARPPGDDADIIVQLDNNGPTGGAYFMDIFVVAGKGPGLLNGSDMFTNFPSSTSALADIENEVQARFTP